MSAPSDQDAATTVLSEAISGSLKELLSDGDVKPLLLACLKEAGCQPPVNHAVLFVLQKAAGGAGKLVATPVGKWLAELFVQLPLVRVLLDKLASLSREGRARAQFIAALRDDLKLPDGSPVPESAELDLVSAMATQRDLDILHDLVAGIGPMVADLLRDQERASTAPTLGWPEQPQGGAARTTASGLMYNSGRDAFAGRDDMFVLLDRFCGDPTMGGQLARFRWMTLVGDGGEGKTRLAYEFTKALEQRGWRAGRLALADLRALNLAQWQPAWPTFIVIDYAAQDATRLFELLSALSRKAQQPMAPVRVLLLERSTSGDWFKRLREGADSEADAVRAYGLVLDSEPWWLGGQLPPLMPDVIIGMMQGRLEEAGVPAVEPDELITAAFKVDRRGHEMEQGIVPLPRPLFALAVAEEIIAAHRSGQPAQQALSRLDRDEVLRAILRRDRQQFWLPAAGGSEAALRPFENLACLATLIGGLTLDQLKAGAFGAGPCLPPPPYQLTPNPLLSPILAAMGLAGDGRVAPLEPDLLGARFVFDHLDRLSQDAGGADQALIAAAWTAHPTNTVEFVGRALFDTPTDVSRLDYLAPSVENLVALEIWASIFPDFVSHFAEHSQWSWVSHFVELIEKCRKGQSDNYKMAAIACMMCTNEIYFAAKAGKWDRVDIAEQRVLSINKSLPGHHGLRTELAKSYANQVIFASAGGEWARADRAMALLVSLLSAYPGNAEIARMIAQASINQIVHSVGIKSWASVAAVCDRNLKIAQTFKGPVQSIAGETVIRAMAAIFQRGPPYLLTADRVAATAAILPQAIQEVAPDRAQFVIGPGLELIKALNQRFRELEPVVAAHDWATGLLSRLGMGWDDVPDLKREAGA